MLIYNKLFPERFRNEIAFKNNYIIPSLTLTNELLIYKADNISLFMVLMRY